jgi:hypothetical protein
MSQEMSTADVVDEILMEIISRRDEEFDFILGPLQDSSR